MRRLFLGSDEHILEFLIEYSVGLIHIAEPLSALKILEIAEQNHEQLEKKCQQKGIYNEHPIVNKEIIFMLMGM